MSNITLREYYQELETLVAQGRLDEVVAHCRHILKFFPKDAAIYRLLGKSYLESRRLSDATDLLQRVLSVVPDDFVSHVGMSLIREDEGNLDAAIWHMERGFEVQPSNSAIRDEVRRLFGKRDGMEPPKIRLTRGALARMYANGNLFQQSISELRSALAEEPQRFDLQVLLARMYYMNGQQVDAAEICNSLLNKLPFCLDANRILAAVLINSDRASEADVYNERLQVLDPYSQHAPPGSLDSEAAADAAINLPHLEWAPGQEIPGTDTHPSWASSLGIDINDSVAEEDDVPDWLKDEDLEVAPETLAAAISAEPLELGEGSDEAEMEMELAEEEQDVELEDALDVPSATPPPETEAEETPSDEEPTEDMIPDWMKDSGWATAESLIDGEIHPEAEGAAVGDMNGEAPPEGGDMPDWLKDMAPESLESGDEEIDLAEDDMSGEIPGWLSSQPPGSTDSVVMWLQDKPEEDDLPKTGPLPTLDPETGEAVPEWLDSVVTNIEKTGSTDTLEEAEDDSEDRSGIGIAAAAGAAAVADSTADWLADEEAAAPIKPEEDTRPRGTGQLGTGQLATPSQEIEKVEDGLGPSESDSGPDAEPEEISGIDWDLEGADAADIPETVAQESEAEDLPEWLTGSGSGEHEVSFDEITDEEQQAAEAVPEWLSEMEKEVSELTDEPIPETEISEGLDAPSEDVGDVPPWMAAAAAAVALDSETDAEPAGSVDPLAEVASTDAPGVEMDSEGLPSEDDQDAALAWLESLAKKQGVDEEELVTEPEDRVEAPPDWVSETMTDFEDEETPIVEMTEAGGEEIPAETETEEWAIDTLDEEEDSAGAGEEVQAWGLETMDSELTDEEQPPWAEDTLTALPKTDELPDWATETMATVSDEDEASSPDWTTETISSLDDDDEQLPEWAAETVTSLPKATDEGSLEGDVPISEGEPTSSEALETLESLEDDDWMRETQIPDMAQSADTPTEEEISEEAAESEPVSEDLPPATPTSEWMVETALPDQDSMEFESEIIKELDAQAETADESEWMVDTTSADELAEEAEAQEPSPEETAEEQEGAGIGLAAAAAAGLAAAALDEPEEAHPAPKEDQPEWMVETALPDMSTVPELSSELEDEVQVPEAASVPEGIEDEVEATPKPEPTSQEEEPEVVVSEADPYLELLEQAKKSLSEGELQAALEGYNRLIRRKKNLDQVITDLQEAVYRYPVDTNILESLGDAHSGSNHLQDALDSYTKAEELLH